MVKSSRKSASRRKSVRKTGTVKGLGLYALIDNQAHAVMSDDVLGLYVKMGGMKVPVDERTHTILTRKELRQYGVKVAKSVSRKSASRKSASRKSASRKSASRKSTSRKKTAKKYNVLAGTGASIVI